jgi:aspartokinase/homoserine dehydrogenase 1
VISEKDSKKAVNVLHEEFFESEIKQIHIYICGIGNVGSKLIQQIYDQNTYLQENFSINLRIAEYPTAERCSFLIREFL